LEVAASFVPLSGSLSRTPKHLRLLQEARLIELRNLFEGFEACFVQKLLK
jgi:hypothetical protein